MKPRLEGPQFHSALAPRRGPRLVTSAPTIIDDASGIMEVRNAECGMRKVRVMEWLVSAAIILGLLFCADVCARALLLAVLGHDH